MIVAQCYSPCPGIFKALVDQGDIFKKGDLIAQLGELDGSVIGEILAPIDGIVSSCTHMTQGGELVLLHQPPHRLCKKLLLHAVTPSNLMVFFIRMTNVLCCVLCV